MEVLRKPIGSITNELFFRLHCSLFNIEKIIFFKKPIDYKPIFFLDCNSPRLDHRPAIAVRPEKHLIFSIFIDTDNLLCWRHFKLATKAIRKQEITFETEKTWIWSKLKNCQNSKILQAGTEDLYILPPIFRRQNPSNPRLWHTVRVTSKLLMDPTNVIASDPQVWLLALIWCKIGIFRYFAIYRWIS